MQAAAAVFARRGLAGTRVADIAEAAGMSQGLAYHYFPGKEELFAALVMRALDGSVALVEEALRRPGRREALRWLGEQMLVGIRHRPEGFLLVLHAVASEAVPEGLQAEALAKGQRVRDAVTRLIAEAQTAGEVGEADPAELAAAFLACIQGLAAGAAFPAPWRLPLPAVDTLLRILPAPTGGEQQPQATAGGREPRPDGRRTGSRSPQED